MQDASSSILAPDTKTKAAVDETNAEKPSQIIDLKSENPAISTSLDQQFEKDQELATFVKELINRDTQLVFLMETFKTNQKLGSKMATDKSTHEVELQAQEAKISAIQAELIASLSKNAAICEHSQEIIVDKTFGSNAMALKDHGRADSDKTLIDIEKPDENECNDIKERFNAVNIHLQEMLVKNARLAAEIDAYATHQSASESQLYAKDAKISALLAEVVASVAKNAAVSEHSQEMIVEAARLKSNITALHDQGKVDSDKMLIFSAKLHEKESELLASNALNKGLVEACEMMLKSKDALLEVEADKLSVLEDQCTLLKKQNVTLDGQGEKAETKTADACKQTDQQFEQMASELSERNATILVLQLDNAHCVERVAVQNTKAKTTARELSDCRSEIVALRLTMEELEKGNMACEQHLSYQGNYIMLQTHGRGFC